MCVFIATQFDCSLSNAQHKEEYCLLYISLATLIDLVPLYLIEMKFHYKLTLLTDLLFMVNGHYQNNQVIGPKWHGQPPMGPSQKQKNHNFHDQQQDNEQISKYRSITSS